MSKDKVSEDRMTRDEELRDEVHEEYDDNWEPPLLLDTTHIAARGGFVQRWVRTKLAGADDVNNVIRKHNQGWRPRSADTIPKGAYVPTVNFNGANVVGIEGAILMERPERLAMAHARRNAKMTDHQMTAVKENMQRVHNRGDGFSAPVFSNTSKQVRAKPVSVADD